uniref:hypothetical protein n=1 Tax=Rhodococcus marinonascens TaxID=38311 RepID=UPI001FE374A0|nr:hypothetical protein [Rhodococcus marinonascens]
MTVGASAVRLIRPDLFDPEGITKGRLPDFQARVIAVGAERPEDVAAESISAVLVGSAGAGQGYATGVAYRDEAQASVVQAAMARQEIGNYQLVPETLAALTFLDASGILGAHGYRE